jgi:hypothetical protein
LSSPKSKEQASDPFEDALKLIEQDASVLNKLPAEIKQQVFYVLLIRGETLTKENKSDESIDKAVEYFVKAVALVSHPGEVLMSYEQTLPADIFKRIIVELQNQNLDKTKAYFASLAPETGLVRFDEMEGPKTTSPTGNSNTKQWFAVATSDSTEGTVLMSEEPDIAICTLKDSQECCDYCFKSLNDHEKEHLADLSYCSKFCLIQACDTYAKHFEKLEGTAAYAYQQLVKVVNETKCYAPLLMLRYISALLENELSRQKLSQSGSDLDKLHLFAHYDYLRPAYRVPRDSDKAEAVLIRTILEPSHQDIGQFLSDEIYVAMKSTVMFNSIGINNETGFSENSEISVYKDDENGSDKPFLKAVESIRVAGTTSISNFFGLYHSYAHLSHSCTPNCELISDSEIPRRLKLVAKREIRADEKLSIAFVESAEKCSKNVIERDFYISCECSA